MVNLKLFGTNLSCSFRDNVKFLRVFIERTHDKNVLTEIRTWHLPSTGLDRQRCALRVLVPAEHLMHIHLQISAKVVPFVQLQKPVFRYI